MAIQFLAKSLKSFKPVAVYSVKICDVIFQHMLGNHTVSYHVPGNEHYLQAIEYHILGNQYQVLVLQPGNWYQVPQPGNQYQVLVALSRVNNRS